MVVGPKLLRRLEEVREGRGRRLLTLGALSLLLAGCGGGPSKHAASGLRADVTVKNFAIDAPTTLKAGSTLFVIHGDGPSLHEFNVARTDLAPDQLPLAADGTVDDTVAHAGFDHLAEAEGIDIGGHKTLPVNLSPGNYVVYCNMDGHYQAGMSRRLTVTA